MRRKRVRCLNENEAQRVVAELGCTRAAGDTVNYVYKSNGFNVYINQMLAFGVPTITIYYGGKEKNATLDLEYFKERLPEFVRSRITRMKIENSGSTTKENQYSNNNMGRKITFEIAGGGVDVGKNIPVVKTVLDTVTSELVYEGFVHVCGDCQSQEYLDAYKSDKNLITLCSICSERRAGLANEKSTSEYMRDNENVLKGVISTLITSVVMFVILALAKLILIDVGDDDVDTRNYFLNMIAIVIPVISGFLMVKIYKLNADAFTFKSVIITAVLCLATAILQGLYLLSGESALYANIIFYGLWAVTFLLTTKSVLKEAKIANVPVKIKS